MTAEIKRKYTPEETAAKRAEALAVAAARLATVFERCPQLKSAVLFVAQYWADEADDAVHCELAYSLRERPDIEAHLARHSEFGGYGEEDASFMMMEGAETAKAIGYVDPYHNRFYPPAPPPPRPQGVLQRLFGSAKPAATIAIPDFLAEERERARALHDLLEGWRYGAEWDANGNAIPLFAAFTKEGAHQEMAYGDAYLPAAIFRRDPEGALRAEIIGAMVRPWLDGVAPEFDPDED